MKRSGIRKNNRGDSLILVIGCIALLSIVGVILLAKTMDNRSMKLAEEQAQASFAGAEGGSAEIVTVIETATLSVIEGAFEDMLLEYSLLADDTTRKTRYNTYFKEKVSKLFEDTDGELKDLQVALEQALGTSVSNLQVVRGDVETEVASEAGYTDTVRVKDVVFTYTTAGSQTSIKTDICVNALIPNVAAGFNSGMTCDFLDFALISDGSVSTINKPQDMIVTGNMYVGGDFLQSGSSVASKFYEAKKMLVKGEVKIDGGAKVTVEDGGVTFNDGEGLWAGGITVDGGTLQTEDVNLYVKDDLTMTGEAPTVKLKGSSSEYVGYSGNNTTTVNHEKSSAIVINEITFDDVNLDGIDDKGLTLDLSELGELYIDGNAYICENNNNWGDGFIDGTTDMKPAEGILQGESVAYKDMQALYLFPGSCLPNHKHNPIIGAINLSEEDIGTPSLVYRFQQEGSSNVQELILSDYVDTENPYVTRTARLDGGATVATYVYLNFKDEASAAQYVKDYMITFLGEGIKAQIKNLKSLSRINLAEENITLSNAISYNGTEVTVHEAANATQKSLLNITSQLAKHRGNGLFSSLRTDGAAITSASYKMVRDGILSTNAFDALPAGEEKEVAVTAPDGSTYMFYAYNGDLSIGDYNKYDDAPCILLVNGNLDIATTGLEIDGLVLVTGNVTQAAGAVLTAKQDVVTTLLENEEVSKFFRAYGNESGDGYLSTEAVRISFENWKKNED